MFFFYEGIFKESELIRVGGLLKGCYSVSLVNLTAKQRKNKEWKFISAMPNSIKGAFHVEVRERSLLNLFLYSRPKSAPTISVQGHTMLCLCNPTGHCVPKLITVCINISSFYCQ